MSRCMGLTVPGHITATLSRPATPGGQRRPPASAVRDERDVGGIRLRGDQAWRRLVRETVEGDQVGAKVECRLDVRPYAKAR